MRLAWLLVLGVLSPSQGGANLDTDFKIIISPDRSVQSLAKRDVARMFLKRTTTWPDGTVVVPVDQSSRSPVRLVFTSEVLKVEGFEKMSAVETYWQQQVFSGRGAPPAVKSGDTEVVAFVAANPGAIGYVSAGADVSQVKTVTVTD